VRLGAGIRKRKKNPVVQTTSRVAPVGHPEPLRTVIDIALSQYDVVWAAGGHPHCVFPISYDQLLRITGGEAAEIGA
jgi:prolyl-tRNA editing enzyme YbaK/EbsC (Cys-tRNA(Pro) deacylase)